MSEKKYCPCCGRHCDLSDPHCGRGEEYIRAGVIPQRRHDHMPNETSYNHTDNEPMSSTEDMLVGNLRDLGHMLRFLYEGKGSQKRILIILERSGGMTQRELTERIGIQPGSASEVIGKLESAGLIRRTPSPKDKRTADIQLTEAGEEETRKAVEQRKMHHREMFSCLSQEEKETLLSLTEKLNRDWNHRYRESNMDDSHRHHGTHHDMHHFHGPHEKPYHKF